MIHKKVFIPVSVDERLPDESYLYFVYATINNDDGYIEMMPQMSHFNYDLARWHINSKTITVTHWLEEKQDQIVITPEELRELFREYISGFMTVDNFLKQKGIV